MIKNKIVIGSANFSLDYGLANNYKKISMSEIKKILKKCEDKKINFIDTAKGYGESEQIIGNQAKKKWNVITKIPKINYKKKVEIENFILKLVYDSLEKLKIKKLYAVLLHDENQLLRNNSNLVYSALKNLKRKNIINKIGVSFYTPKKLIKIISKFHLDIVQIPVNYINQSFLEKKVIKKLKNKKIEIHARSIFLQGLLLKKDLKKKRFKKFSNYLNFWHEKNKISRLESSINFINNQKFIDKYIIGFQSLEQINQILKTKKVNITSFPKYNDKYLKDPRKWVY